MASAPAPMATIPAARPSSPSMKLMALVSAITQAAVMSGITPGVSTMNPAKGILNSHIVTPKKYRMLAARTWPAILAGADMSRTSSMRPTTNMAPAASTTPSISGESVKIGRRAGMAAAKSTATRKPRNMAAPPP